MADRVETGHGSAELAMKRGLEGYLEEPGYQLPRYLAFNLVSFLRPSASQRIFISGIHMPDTKLNVNVRNFLLVCIPC